MSIKPNANLEVVQPENSRALNAPLKKGAVSVDILEVLPENPEHDESENHMVVVKYPNGQIQHHQIAVGGDAAHIVTKIRNKIKGYHGHEDIGDLKTKLPTNIEDLAGKTLIFGGVK